MEAAEANAQQLKGELHVGKVACRSTSENLTEKQCYRCSRRGHGEWECRFKDFICSHCKKKAHLAKVCRSQIQSSSKQAGGRGRGQSKHRAKWIEAASTEKESNMPPDRAVLIVTDTPSRPTTVPMELNDQLVSMGVDTGAIVSLISYSNQQRLFPSERLEKSDVHLTTYMAEPIPVLEVMNVSVEYGDYCGMHPLYVVPGNGPSLLGRDWLQSIRLNWSSLKVGGVSSSPHSLQSLLQKYV